MKPHKIYGISESECLIEGAALDQFYNALEQPWVVQGALMPDAHFGYSLPIGGVVATDHKVVPAWVGYDIGCGVCAIKTSFAVEGVDKYARKIYKGIKEAIPVGFKHNNRATSWPRYDELQKTPWFDRMFTEKGGLKQLGTLGGGNHFMEIGVDEEDAIWIVIHSGSRNVGHSTAQYYMREACFLATGRRKAREGHFPFEVTSGLGLDYIRDHKVCLEFALQNRKEMLYKIGEVMNHLMEGGLEWDILINRTHNHVEVKTADFIIHRKGATHAEEGMLGVIPGNMRDGSYIVRGKGCRDSLYSSSHGAGRVLGRKRAKETLDVDTFRSAMSSIVCHANKDNIDESPAAYKNISSVLDMQKDLVEVVAHITPIINVKG
jgi:tRNA-splicing ligase RtcB